MPISPGRGLLPFGAEAPGGAGARSSTTARSKFSQCGRRQEDAGGIEQLGLIFKQVRGSAMSDPNGPMNLSGLQFFTLRDYVRLLSRRKWLIVFVTFAFAVAVAVVTFFIPNS